MNVIVFDSYEDLCRRAEEEMREAISGCEKPLLCLAAGHSSYGVFDCMKEQTSAGYEGYRQADYVGLDEWGGLTKGGDGSMRDFMDKNCFGPVGVPEDHLVFPDGTAEPAQECRRIDTYLENRGPIDCILLGLGLSGHVALNEPGCDPDARTHTAGLHPETKGIMGKFFENPVDLDWGITLGFGTIREARRGILVVNGTAKARIVKKMMTEPVSMDCPASILRTFPQFTMMLDREAAALLNEDQ